MWLQEFTSPDQLLDPEIIGEDEISRHTLIQTQRAITEFQDPDVDPHTQAEKADISRIIRNIIEGDELDLRQKKILVLRKGLQGEDPKTLEAVGEEFGVTVERIRQIETQAIRRIKVTQNGKDLKVYGETYGDFARRPRTHHFFSVPTVQTINRSPDTTPQAINSVTTTTPQAENVAKTNPILNSYNRIKKTIIRFFKR